MIGQASIDERGKIAGGAPGDQTGKELNIKEFYSHGWDIVLRFRDRAQGRKAAAVCRALIQSNKVGYDQSARNTLRAAYKAAKGDISKLALCECDCSSLMAVCAEAAGVAMDVTYVSGNAPATFQMRKQYAKTGAFEVLIESKYRSSDKYLRAGDILLCEAKHTCMVLDDGEAEQGQPEGHEWSKEARERAVASGLIKGSVNPDGTVEYGWEKPVTLERLVVILDRLKEDV